MASNSILKLQVDDKQYEASLKSAQQGLQALMNALRNSGKSFSDLDKNTEQYVRALGNMGATAKNTRGRIGEMSSAFVELSQVEKQLTDQERQSPVGKALAESLEQLKQRTIEAKQGLADLDKQLTSQKAPATTDGGGLFGGGKLSGMLQVMGGNLMTKGVTLAAGAITSMTNEIGDAVKQGIELAKQGEGIRIAFERLGRGDILDGLREATHGTVTDIELMKAAVKFNDFKLPVEELGTMLAFAQQKAKDTGQSVDYMVDSIVTGLGRKSLMILDNLGLSATEVKERMKETGDMTKAVGAIIRDQMAKAGDYVETAADRAAQANVSLQNKMEELGRKFAPVEEASNQLWTSMKIGILDIVGGPLAELLNGLTEAGRLRNMLGEVNGEGTNTKVGGQLGKLRVSKAAGSDYMTRTLYSGTIEEYNRQITKADELLQQFEKNHSSVNVVLQDATKQFGRKFSSISELEAMKGALAAMREEYKKGAQEIINSSKVTAAAVGTTGGGGNKGGSIKTVQTELQQNQAKINALTQEYVRLGDMSTQSAEERKAAIQDEIEKLKERNGLLGKYAAQAQGRLMLTGSDINMKGLGSFSETLNPFAADNRQIQTHGALKVTLDDKFIEDFNRTMADAMSKKNDRDVFADSKKLVSGLSQVAGGLEQMGIKLPEEVQQVIAVINGVMSVIEGVNTVLSVFGVSIMTANTAAITANTAALWAVAATNLIPGLAGGGIIKAAGGTIVGNSYSGDNLRGIGPGGQLYGLNAGEVVLNRAESGIIASALDGAGSGFKNGTIVGVLEGEKIKLVLNRHYQRIGEGEVMTWRNG